MKTFYYFLFINLFFTGCNNLNNDDKMFVFDMNVGSIYHILNKNGELKLDYNDSNLNFEIITLVKDL